jgi:tRNA-Thr(GGU) m(6)t(6)A37 methyltransferase TsaA
LPGKYFAVCDNQFTVKPIGYVRSKVKWTPRQEYDWNGIVSEIVVDRSLAEALYRLEESSHIIVLCWMHKAVDPDKMALKVRYKGDPKMPLVGLFASRSPYRPNPVGQKLVKLLNIEGNVLRVEGLDAVDGTPVIDIKPYIPGYDSAAEATKPPWSDNK